MNLRDYQKAFKYQYLNEGSQGPIFGEDDVYISH